MKNFKIIATQIKYRFIIFFLVVFSTHSKAQTISNYSICLNDSTVLKVNLPIRGAIQWQKSIDKLSWTNIASATADSVKVKVVQDLFYRASVTEGTCLPIYSDTIQVSLINYPVISLQPSTINACNGGSGMFAVFPNSGFLYQWQVNSTGTWVNVVNNVTYSGATSATLTVNNITSPLTANQYRCVLSNSCPLSTVSNTVGITLISPITGLSATASPNPICQSSTLTLTGAGSNVTNWQWNGPPSFSATTQIASKICGLPGAGIYTLTASNACGTLTALTASVIVRRKPYNVVATTSVNPINAGQSINFIGSGDSTLTWSWSGPNSYTSTLQSPTIVTSSSLNTGIYTLTASNQCGSTTAAVSVTVSTPANYYVSFTGGNDLNNGLSPATPWKTFLNVNAKTFIPGDKIYLKSGDTWNEELNLNGSGSITNPIILSTYSGTLQANIWRTDKALHKSVVMNKPSYWNVSNLDCRTGKIGIYLRFDNFETGKNVTITNCFLKDYDNGEFDAAINNYEYALSAGIWLGGFVPAPASDLSLAYYNVFDSLTVKFCGFENCDVGLGTNFYFPPVYYTRVKNIFFSDSYSLNCLNGIQHFFNTTGGLTTRVRSLYSGGYSPNGTTGGFLQSCNSYTVDNCEFAFTDRNNCADGVGFDFEGDTHDCVFSNNVVHDNDGPAMLVMSTAGTNTNVLIFNNTYYNNAINPYNSLFHEMLGYDGNTNGIVTNSGFYKGPGVTTFSTLWNNFTLAGNRETTPYSSVSSLPYTWEFNTASNLEGWNSFNTWTGNTVSGGNLNGTSGIDAYALSSSVFVNSFEKWKVRVRMRQSAGTTGQLFYITDADPNWNVAKSVTFTITPDGTFYDYIIDLKQSDLKGVITQIRLDPTNSSGSNMAIDYIRVE